MKSIEGLARRRLFEYAFWAVMSVIAGAVIYRVNLLDFWRPDSGIEALSVKSIFFLLALAVLLVTVRSKLVIDSGFLEPLRKLAEDHPVLFKVLLISFPVILFNLVNVFGPHYLLNDDPARYRAAIDRMITWSAWTQNYKLSAFTEWVAAWMTVNYSPFVVRLLYVLLYLTGISFCTYWISRRIFNLSSSCSYLAAVLPAIYPLQYQVIAGINVSYTLPGQLLALAALICGFCYLTRERHSWFLAILAGSLFAASTRMMEQAIFLSAAIGFIYLVTSRNIARKLVLLTPVAAASALVLYKMITTPRGAATPRDIPVDAILGRVVMFFEYLSPVRLQYSIVLVLLLLLAGLISFRFWSGIRDRVSEPLHFAWIPINMRCWILPVFAFAWTFFSAVPFIALNSHMAVRTIHLAGYGPWLVMAPGLVFLGSAVFFFMNSPVRKRLVVFIVFLTVTCAGFEHISYSINRHRLANYHWDILSSVVSRHAFPADTQVVVTDANMGSYSSYHICTGYLCRLLGNRLDVGGVVGPEYFYYDPFCQKRLWTTRMTGLRETGNLQLFRLVTGQDSQPEGFLQPYQYFLRVITSESPIQEGEAAGDWRLYEFDSRGRAKIRNSGHGLDQYKQLLAELSAEGIVPKQICWGDPENEPGGNSPIRD